MSLWDHAYCLPVGRHTRRVLFFNGLCVAGVQRLLHPYDYTIWKLAVLNASLNDYRVTNRFDGWFALPTALRKLHVTCLSGKRPTAVGPSMRPFWRATLLFVSFFLTCFAFGQDGDSTAGLARTRAMGLAGVLPTARDVVVEDFVNYHRHEIARPKAGEAVGLDVRWVRDKVDPGGEAVLQVGMSTALVHDTSELRPLDLSVVIDKSGSMADDRKLVRVKAALKTLVARLRPTDVLSIVVFDSNARVLVPACRVTDPEAIVAAIDAIEPGSATNLNGGLMLGYEEALKNYREDGSNRVILLTDGIANRGVTDPDEIAAASAKYNDRGIDLCTIGVGSDVNQDFLSRLARDGRGLFHFIAGSEDIDKVFVDDLQSQLSPVAKEPELTIRYGSGLVLDKVYGYDPRFGEDTVKLKLDTMNSGMTEAVLVRFKANAGDETGRLLPVDVRLAYYDLDRKKEVVVHQSASVALTDSDSEPASLDRSVEKNYCIAQVAEAIRDMAADCERQRFAKAQMVLDKAISQASARYPNLADPDIARTVSIACKYRDVLREHNKGQEGDDVAEAVSSAEGSNIVVNGDFSQGNSHFISGVGDYVAPATNALWSGPYTIAPVFDQPMLHTLVQPGEYAAPERPNGNEQVLFANAGGFDSLVVWSSIVNCRPHTRYRITFNAISLSGSQWAGGHEIPTEDWAPAYQITIDGAKSSPQRAGCGHYSKISMIWDSAGATTATVSIVRMPMTHNGGIIGIANIKMVPIR